MTTAPAPHYSGGLLPAVVVGAGPAGLSAALALAASGCPVSVLAPLPVASSSAASDRRTAALFAGSMALLRNLGVWEGVRVHCAPITAIRIVDDTGGLLRGPELLFTAAEVGLDVFGYNVPNGPLNTALLEVARRHPLITLIDTPGVTAIDIASDRARLTLQDGSVVEALLVVGADGRHSPSRAAAGIGARTWRYAQSALVTSFRHSRPHRDISSELHRPNGPLTTVPLPGNASSLVWVESPEEAARLAALEEPTFIAELEQRLQGLLGTISDLTPRVVFPLSSLQSETAGRNRVALVGEAGHVFPPIGAQGLNLSLRDAATLAECVGEALRHGADPGGRETLHNYAEKRARDVDTRVIGVDLLNRSLISGILPTHLARGLGLHLLGVIGPLRRMLIREGLQPTYATPKLMREGAEASGASHRP